MDYAWVIEAGTSSVPLYWTGFDWSHNHMQAIRYAREEDAMTTSVHIPTVLKRSGMRIREHGWERFDVTPAYPAEQQPLPF